MADVIAEMLGSIAEYVTEREVAVHLSSWAKTYTLVVVGLAPNRIDTFDIYRGEGWSLEALLVMGLKALGELEWPEPDGAGDV
jgi:hypothetical protein